MSENAEARAAAPVWGWFIYADGFRSRTTSDVVARYVALYGQPPITRFVPDPSAQPKDGAA